MDVPYQNLWKTLVYKTTKSSESSGDPWQFCSICKWQQGGGLEGCLLTWYRKCLDFGGFCQSRPESFPREPLVSITRLDYDLPQDFSQSVSLCPQLAITQAAVAGPGSANLKTELTHLLIVPDLIVQDDAIGLLRLWPWQGDAPHGGTDLVHDGNGGRGCGEMKRQNI